MTTKKASLNTQTRYIIYPSGKRDSNPRPSAWEADALPTELLPQFECKVSDFLRNPQQNPLKTIITVQRCYLRYQSNIFHRSHLG